MRHEEELEKLRSEARELRQRNGVVENAWQGQTERASREKKRAETAERQAKTLETENKELKKENKDLKEEVQTLKAKLMGVTIHKDKLAGMLFKTVPKKISSVPSRRVGGQTGHTGHGRKKPVREPDEERTTYLSHCPT